MVELEKKKKKKKKSTSDGNTKKRKSSKRSRETGLKGKSGPKWKREMQKVLMHLKVQSLDWYNKIQTNEQFRQNVLTYVMAGLTVLVIVLYWLQGDGGGTSTIVSVGVKTGGVRGPSGGKIIDKPAQLQLTKRQREKLEKNFDVSGPDLLSVKRRFGTRSDYETAQTQARAPLSAKDEKCFKSMQPTVRRDSTIFSVYQPKKVFDLPVLQRAHKALGWVEETDLKKASLVLKGVPRVTFRQLKEGKQYYDMVASLGRIGSKKKTQLATLRNHVRKFKCSFESLHIQPRSWDMNKPSDCQKFFKNPDKGSMWVLKSCKNGEGARGAGISVLDDLSEKRAEFGECKENAFNYVAQEYIEHPLLVHNRKFDMRVYLFVAATKPNYIVYFNPGYIRRSLAEYKPTSTKTTDVLTNYHIQVDRKDFKPGDAMWHFPQFIEYLKETNQCVACGDIEMKIAQISKLVFDSGRSYYKRFAGSFQIVGLDFMMDANLNVQFIEGNVSPGIGNHGLKWKRELMDDLVQLIYKQVVMIHETPQDYDLRIGERVYGQYNNYWELIINEHYEKCNKANKFDPCKELQPEGVVENADDLRAAEDSSSSSDDDEED